MDTRTAEYKRRANYIRNNIKRVIWEEDERIGPAGGQLVSELINNHSTAGELLNFAQKNLGTPIACERMESRTQSGYYRVVVHLDLLDFKAEEKFAKKFGEDCELVVDFLNKVHCPPDYPKDSKDLWKRYENRIHCLAMSTQQNLRLSTLAVEARKREKVRIAHATNMNAKITSFNGEGVAFSAKVNALLKEHLKKQYCTAWVVMGKALGEPMRELQAWNEFYFDMQDSLCRDALLDICQYPEKSSTLLTFFLWRYHDFFQYRKRHRDFLCAIHIRCNLILTKSN